MHQLADEADGRLASLKGETAGHLIIEAPTTIAQYAAGNTRRFFVSLLAEGVANRRFGSGRIEGPPKKA
jgi:hypothetical protein